MIKRISRSLSDVAAEVLETLKHRHGITDQQLAQLRQRVHTSNHNFPLGGIKVPLDVLWIDYQVQRDVIIKHILALLKKWDNRICQPAACNTHPSLVEQIDFDKNIYKFKQLFIFDAQHRCVTLAVLGYKEFYVTVVVDQDPTFASYAFRESNSTIKKIGVPDQHRNNLRLHSLGVFDPETTKARHLQDQFDNLGIDLMEDMTWNIIPDTSKQRWYMSHFDYAYKAMGADPSGKTAYSILKAITTAWPNNNKIQNGIYIGLNHMNEVVKGLGVQLNDDWMIDVCQQVAISFNNSNDVEESAKRHIKAIGKTETWNVPEGMYKFMREVYFMNGGNLPIPSTGANLNLSHGIWVDSNLIPNHKNKFKALVI